MHTLHIDPRQSTKVTFTTTEATSSLRADTLCGSYSSTIGGAEATIALAIRLCSKDSLLSEVILMLLLVEVRLLIICSTDLWEVSTSMSGVVTSATVFLGDGVSCSTLLWVGYLLLLHELVRMLLQWCRLDLTFTEFFSGPYSSSRYSFDWHGFLFELTCTSIVVISIEVIEQQISVLMISIQMIDYLTLFIDLNPNALSLEIIIVIAKVFPIASNLYNQLLLILDLLLLQCSWYCELLIRHHFVVLLALGMYINLLLLTADSTPFQ
jgi:hypothetical protein